MLDHLQRDALRAGCHLAGIPLIDKGDLDVVAAHPLNLSDQFGDLGAVLLVWPV